MSKTRSLHHIVFATANRYPLIPLDSKRELYNYIFGILKNHRCFVHRINGMAEHIHILIDLNPSVALSDLVRDVKRSSSFWMRDNPNYLPNSNWSKGYYAMSLSPNDIQKCIKYIMNQEEHHSKINFMDEAKELAAINGLQWYPDDWE